MWFSIATHAAAFFAGMLTMIVVAALPMNEKPPHLRDKKED